MDTHVAVLGAGSSGLAAMKGLREQGLGVEGFERGSDVGGLWRYENDNGLSAAYASLRTNVSRSRMQYPSFAMPTSYGDFPNHREMAAYLGAYADAYELRDSIRFRTRVERLEPAAGGTWRVTLDDGSRRSYGAVVVATGLFWSPRLSSACPRQSECGRQSNTPNRAPASGSRTKAHAAFAVTRTPTDGSYTPTCGEHGGRH